MQLIDKIQSGKFVVLGEFEPPKGSDFNGFLNDANLIKGRLDAIVVPEMANGVLKASSLGGSTFLKMHGIEPVMQICCRDRNRLALQADILAASTLGISNIMAVPGDDIRFGDHPQARAVNDLDLFQLLETLQTLQSGKDLAGINLAGAPQFCTGSFLNAGASGGFLDMELDNLQKMIDMNVQFVITTPVFDVHRFQLFIKRIDTKQVAIIPTILLLKSAGMARYIDRNIKDINIPAETIREIQKAPDKPKRCIQIAAELINQIKALNDAFAMPARVLFE